MTSRRVLVAMFLAICGTGCGLKGPLYLPDKPQTVPAANKNTEDEKTNADKKAAPRGTGEAPLATSTAGPSAADK